MKKILLAGLALAGVLSLPVGVHAEKTYVQLTSGNQLAEGAKYAVSGVYNASNDSWERFYTLNDNAQVVHQPLEDDATIAENQVWSLQALPNCPDHWTFAMVQDGKYVLNTGDDQNYFNTSETVANTAYVEFQETTHSTFSGEQLFALRYNASSGTSATSRGVGYNTSTNVVRWGKFSNTNDYNAFINTQNTQWTTLHRVYLEIDTDKPAEAAHAYWNQICAEKSTWASNISDELVDLIKAMAFPTDVEWNAETLQSQAEVAFYKELSSVVGNYLDGQSISFTNVGKEMYLVSDSDDSYINKVSGLTARAEWVIEAVETGGFLVKNVSTGKYVGTLPASANNAWITLVDDKANAGVYGVVIANVASHYTFIRTYDALTTVNQWHTNGGYLQAWSGDGTFSQHIINIYDPFGPIQHERDEYVAEIQALDGYSAFTSEEISAAVDALNAISFDNLTVSEENIAAKQVEVDNVITSLWSNYDNLPILVKFYRSSTYVAANGTTATGVQTFTPEAAWYLQHTTGMNFKLYNIEAGTYLMQGSTDEWTFVAGSSSTYGEVGQNNWLALQHAVYSTDAGYNCLHKNNTTTDGFIWYYANDQGSAIQIINSAEGVLDFMQLDPVLDSEEDNWLFGKTSEAKLNKLTAAVDALSPDDIAGDNFAETWASIVNLYTNLITPTFYVTIEASENNNGANVGVSHDADNIALYYSTTMNGNQTQFDGTDKTEANSIWFFDENKMLNYDNGFYLNASSGNFLICNASADSNSGTAIKFVEGYNEEGTYQLIYNNGRGLHLSGITSNGVTGFKANVCGENNYAKRNELAHNLAVTRVDALPVAIHSDGFGSIVSPLPLNAPSAATATYVAEIVGSKLTFEQVESSSCNIAPGAHVLIKGTPNTTVYVPVAYEADAYAYAPAAHDQLAGHHAARVVTAESDMNYYVKAEKPADAEGISLQSDETSAAANFSKLTVEDGTVTIPAASMVVVLPVETANTDTLDIDPEGEPLTTGIGELTIDGSAAESVVYDLQGRRLAAPVKGINIINGKKVLVK